jgi:hypothetical protein
MFLKSTREIVPARAFVSENGRGVIQRTRFTAAWDRTRCVDPDDTLTFAVKGVPEPEVMKVSSQSSPSIYAARTVRLAGVSLIAVLAVVASMELKNQAPQQVPRANARTDTVVLADSDDDVAQQEEEEEQQQEQIDEENQLQQQLAEQEMLQSEQEAEQQNEMAQQEAQQAEQQAQIDP